MGPTPDWVFLGYITAARAAGRHWFFHLVKTGNVKHRLTGNLNLIIQFV